MVNANAYRYSFIEIEQLKDGGDTAWLRATAGFSRLVLPRRLAGGGLSDELRDEGITGAGDAKQEAVRAPKSRIRRRR